MLISYMWLRHAFKKSLLFYIIAAILSFILTFIILSYHQPFNDDAIVQYLKFSKLYLEKGFSAASTASQWPFYSLLIAGLSRGIHISLETSAQLINAIFDAATVVIFLLLIRELGGRKRTQWFALAVVLLFPLFSHARNDIIREHGYWCFSLLSFWYLIRYVRWGYWSYALGWGLSILLATLFRIEGFFIALIAPIAVWFRWADYGGIGETTKRFVKAYSVIIFVSGLLVIILGIYHAHLIHFLSRLWEIKNQLLEGWRMTYVSLSQKAQLINKVILPPIGNESPVVFTIGGLVALWIRHLIRGMELLYVVLCFYGLINIKSLRFDLSSQIVWVIFVLCNLVIGFLFLTEQFFLVERYIGLLIFLLLLIVPFSLDWLYQQWIKNKMRFYKSLRWIVALLLMAWLHVAFSALGYFGPSKTYITETGQWVKRNIPATELLYTNNVLLTYYSNRWDKNITFQPIEDNLQADILSKFDYVILAVGRKDRALAAQILQLPLKRVKAFSNRRGDCAIIFRVLHNEPSV